MLRARALQPAWELLHALALRGMNFDNYDEAVNGELSQLDRVATGLGPSPVVFDVGANAGRYSMEVLKRFSSVRLYAFEPSAVAFAQLEAALGNRAQAFQLALADVDAEGLLYGDRPGSELASLVRRDLHRFDIEVTETETVQVRRLDTFCDEHRIDRIDWLKIDAEGSEVEVLRGAGEMLGSRIGAIQFEFGGTGIDANHSLRDFFDLLEAEYRIHRLLPDGLRPFDYSERVEIFLYANYIAVPRSWRGKFRPGLPEWHRSPV
jgi:FkbM family methyltransferase